MLSKLCFELVFQAPRSGEIVFTGIRVHDLRSVKCLREMLRVRMFGNLSKSLIALVPVKDLPIPGSVYTRKGYGGLDGAWLSHEDFVRKFTDESFPEAWGLRRVIREFGFDLV